MIGKATLRWLIGLLAIVAILIVLLLTSIGLRIGLHFASAILPGQFTYEHASGTITGPIEIRNLVYTHEKTTLSVHKLKFSWKPWKLLHRKIDVTHFAARDVHLTLQPAKSKAAEALEIKKAIKTPTRKPYLLVIHHAHVDYLYIGAIPNKYPVLIRHIRAKARIIPDRLSIQTQVQISKPFPLQVYFNATGNLDRYTLYARAISQKSSWHLYGLGNSNGVFLNLKEGKTLGGKLSFNADLKWAPKIQWDVDLNGSNLNFKQLDPNWPNQITLNLLTQGSIENGTPKFTLSTLITAPGTHIDLKVAQKNKMNLKWNLNIANLSHVYKKFKGSLQSKGEWSPETHIPVTQGQLQANHFSILGYSGNSLMGKWSLYPNQHRASSFSVRGTNLKTPTLHLNNARLEGKGSAHAHQLNGSVGIQRDQFTFQMRGGLTNKVWKGELQKLTIRSKQYRRWQLTKPTPITLSETHATAKNLCLKPNGIKGQLCLNGNWNANTAWQFTAKGERFDSGLLTSFVLPELNLKSPSTLRATITGQGKTLESVKANILLHKGELRYQFNGTYLASPLQQGNINVFFTKNNLSVSSQLILTKKNILSLSLSLPNFSHKTPIDQLRINGKLRADFNDLTPFSKVLKAIANPTGKLAVNLNISGQLPTPDVRGKVSLRDGSVFIPRLSIELTKISTDISSFSKNRLNYKITAYSKSQPLHINGQIVATPQGVKNTTTIDGKNVLIMNTSEYTIYATPKLKAVIQGYNIDLTGSVNIPKGMIQPKEFTNTVSLPTNQIVYTAGEPPTIQSTWKITANVDVSLGNDVQVKTSGFNTTVTGKATIIGKPKTTTLANGRINIVKGVYSAYGKTLNISPGSYIQFLNSPVDNPNFSIRATKIINVTRDLTGRTLGVNDIIVGIELRGSFHNPKISLFSIPATLSQADILSYLLLGYASESSSGSNLGLLLEAANSLGGKGTGIGGAISEIKQGLGLAELGVESETVMSAVGTPLDQQTAFVIGKRLTRNIYIRYSLGLGQGPYTPVNIFQLRYTLNPHWSIQTDSSTLGNGGDILYTIQTD